MFWSFHPLADKQITNTYRNHFSRSYKNRSIRHSPRHKPEAWISFLTSSPTHNYMCTNSTYSWKTRKCAFLFISISFFDGGGGSGARGWGIFSFHGLPFLYLLNTWPSLLRQTETVTLPHETTTILMYQTNPVGVELFSLTLSFVSIFSGIPEWLSQKHSFLKHNFVAFHLSFWLKRYRYHQIFLCREENANGATR